MMYSLVNKNLVGDLKGKAEERALVLFTTQSSASLKLLSSILSKSNSVWLLVDRSTMELIARSELMRKIDASRIIVYSGKKPEELSLKLHAMLKPDVVYACDENSSLKPVLEYLLAAGIRVVKC